MRKNGDAYVVPVFFEKRSIDGENLYYIWQYKFSDKNDYNSISLVKSARFNAIAPGSLAFHRRIPKASSPVDHLFRKSEGVTPKCFLNWRVKCCG